LRKGGDGKKLKNREGKFIYGEIRKEDCKNEKS
jgi:hypothetical protein